MSSINFTAADYAKCAEILKLSNEELIDKLSSVAIASQAELASGERLSKDDADTLYFLKHELLRRLNGWKDIALHLGDVHAANTECLPKSVSRREKERLAHICEDTLLMYQCGEVVGHRKSEETRVKDRLAEGAKRIREELKAQGVK